MSKHQRNDEGIGLFSKEQERYTTRFQYFGQIVVGTIVLLCGVGILISVLTERSKEILRFGNPQPHFGGFISAGAFIVIGIGMAHAGVIFWSRRLRARNRRDRGHSHATPD